MSTVTTAVRAPVEAAPDHPAALAAWAVGGPLLMGAAFGATFAPGRGFDVAPADFALAWPMAIIGVSLLCGPTLYIAAAFTGVAPDPRRTAVAFARTLGAVGKLLVGCLPAAAFLAATNPGPGVLVLSGLVLAFAACIGLRGLYRRIFADDARARTRALYLGWSVIYLAIGLYAYASLLSD